MNCFTKVYSMGFVTEEITIDSIRTIGGMELAQKVTLCDRIYIQQPYLFQEILALSRSDIPLEKMEHLYHLLMVVHTAFSKVATDSLKTIEISDIDAIVDKNKKMFNFFELELDKRAMHLSIDAYPEKYLLAYAIDYLIQHGIKGQTEEQAKIVFMARVILDSYIHICKKSQA